MTLFLHLDVGSRPLEPLSVDKLIGAFYILTMGLVIGLVSFFIELLFHKKIENIFKLLKI